MDIAKQFLISFKQKLYCKFKMFINKNILVKTRIEDTNRNLSLSYSFL